MHLRLSLRNRIFIVLGIITILTLLIVWTVIRPKYEASVITERLTIVQQLQSYTIENLDRTITSWSDVTRFIVGQITERPKEGEILLRSMMTLHPEIIQIKIRSPKLSDELTSQNTSYPAFNIPIKDSAWVCSKIDTTLYIQWINDTLQHQELFIMQTRFNVQNIPFVLTITWDAKKLNTLFAALPIGENYSVSIKSLSAVLIQNQSSFKPVDIHGMEERVSALQSVYQNKSNWRVLTGAFKTAQLWLIIAVPEKTILRPVEDLLLYTTSLVLGFVFIMLVLGWMLANQISRPIARLVSDVQKLSNLDFAQSIQIPAIKDLRGMGETIELMRQVLERYQRLNVEKIRVSWNEAQLHIKRIGMDQKEVVLGVDIGGTNTTFGYVDREGKLLAEASMTTEAHQPSEEFFERLHKQADILFESGKENFKLIGIGLGAPNANYYKGTIEQPPNLNWKFVDVVSILRRWYSIPIALTNDANAAALGEMLFGAAKGMKDFMVITLGTGLGSGIVANGELIYGHDGFAGEIGHTIVDPNGRLCGCGRRGCLETYASASGIRRTVEELLHTTSYSSELREVNLETITSKRIFEAAQHGDKLALEAFEMTGRYLGLKLADSIAYTSPEAIILCGGLAASGDFVFNPTKKYMEEYLLNIFKNKVRLLPSGLPLGNSAILGAAALIWKDLMKT